MKQSLALYTCACFADDMLSTTYVRGTGCKISKASLTTFLPLKREQFSCISVTKNIVLHLIFSSFSLNLEGNEQQQETKVIMNEPLLP